MMAKIVKGRSFKGCINYILDEKKQTVLLDAQSVRLKSKASIIRSFVTQAKLKSNLGISVGHISFSFSAQDKDKVTPELMVKIVREYMQEMGIKDTQYIVAQHFDKEHPHCHLCFNRVDNNGKTISDRNDQIRSASICRELTEKYGLYIASGKENVKMDRLKEPDKTKYEIYHILKGHIPECKNWEQLTGNLNKQGVDVRFKYKGQINEVQGVVFSKNGYSFNGSKVDRMFSYSRIDYQLGLNNQGQSQSPIRNLADNQRDPSKGIIESTLDALSGMNLFQPNGDNYEDEAFRNRLEYETKKRKKKFRRGL